MYFSLHILELNPLNAELNPICHLLALLGARHIFHVSGLRVNGEGECQARSSSAVALLVVFNVQCSTGVSEHTSDKALDLRRKGKGKGKVGPVTCHGGTDGE
jgi:hypothetical protein